MLLGTVFETEQTITKILENSRKTNLVPVSKGNGGGSIEQNYRPGKLIPVKILKQTIRKHLELKW